MKVLKFLMETNSINALHGQVTVGTLILQVCHTFFIFCVQDASVSMHLVSAVVKKKLIQHTFHFSFFLKIKNISQFCDILSPSPSGLCCWPAVCTSSNFEWYIWPSSRSCIYDEVVSATFLSPFCPEILLLPLYCKFSFTMN